MTRRQAAADRLWRGSALLASDRTERLAGWVRATGRRRAAVLRLAVLIAVGMVVWRIVRAVPSLLWLIVPAWCVTAWRAAPPAGIAAEASSAPPVDAVLELLSGLIADRPGVHLSTVLDQLQENGHGEDWRVADLRARLEALGVPVRRSVKVAGRVAYGVHRDDLAGPPPETTPDHAV